LGGDGRRIGGLPSHAGNPKEDISVGLDRLPLRAGVGLRPPADVFGHRSMWLGCSLPILIDETVKAQSADIDMVSGATVTRAGEAKRGRRRGVADPAAAVGNGCV
jgi:hypothetical protein